MWIEEGEFCQSNYYCFFLLLFVVFYFNYLVLVVYNGLECIVLSVEDSKIN